ncbi:Lysine-sensitive aspartokinase [Trichinella spiralis]|uniref:Lysine-sensitive aspartokinase n=1 Tax=Trichinella spiralis TaxID=6334 RepID=A0ABR3KP58_TRISP
MCQLFPLLKTDRRKLRLEEEHRREKCSLFNLARENFVQRNSTDKRVKKNKAKNQHSERQVEMDDRHKIILYSNEVELFRFGEETIRAKRLAPRVTVRFPFTPVFVGLSKHVKHWGSKKCNETTISQTLMQP